jgi:hypothetical protein
MGILLAFAVGYAIGARAGSENFDEVVDSVKAVRDSEEFASLVKALRSHAGHTLRELASLVDGTAAPSTGSAQDLVERVRKLIG